MNLSTPPHHTPTPSPLAPSQSQPSLHPPPPPCEHSNAIRPPERLPNPLCAAFQKQARGKMSAGLIVDGPRGLQFALTDASITV